MSKHPHKEKDEKTNVMRLLDAAGVAYVPHQIPLGDGDPLDGVTAARRMGKEPEEVFKTLVAQGPHGEHFVFVIPVAESLDLKKAAKAVGEKSVAMLPQKELLPLTGYVHGGCSPVGMKKQFPTVFHETALLYGTVCVSAGKIGRQIEVRPDDLIAYVGGTVADLTVS